jgi:hypothetical protein
MTAPAWSIARWKPYTRPRSAGSAQNASSASRGALRTPLPTRSANRMASTCPQPVTPAMSGRDADESV